MYPDGRTNPVPAHFARKMPVEMHPPTSKRLLQQRHLDREGRAICRIVYSHGIGVEIIATVFCVSEDTVIQAIENNPTRKEHDNAGNDYWYVSEEYRNQYPSLSKQGYHQTVDDNHNCVAPHAVVSSSLQQGRNGQSKVSEPHKSSSTKKAHSAGYGNECGDAHQSNSDDAIIWLKNPTPRHFKDNLVVTQIDGSSGRLDRKGRAICRIMHRYLENYTKIALIFGITHTRVRRAVLNDYVPGDDVAEDYDYAGKGYKNEYPSLSKKGDGHLRDSDKRPRSPELDDVPVKRAKLDPINNPRTTQVPQKIPFVEVPSRPKADPGAASIRSFLKNIGGFDLSQWQETFKEKGLKNMGDLTTLARLEEARLVKTLTRLFADKKMAEVHILLLADALLDLAKDAA
ncbi:hypothetical protein B0H19DRAFT_1375570 [Mycena capillaripes]|nr:hypothetical protein B0H19DRAFT_1375570 [Mycena capillaripes]